MSDTITGGCLCGQVRYELAERPRLLCHRADSKKQSGTAFSTVVYYLKYAIFCIFFIPL